LKYELKSDSKLKPLESIRFILEKEIKKQAKPTLNHGH
jgi:hypothetical protein